MPARRLLVRKIREVLRLKHERGLSHRAIAQACAIGVGTVSLYLQRTAQQGLGWPLPAELNDAALEARLFRRAAPAHDRVRPDCAYIHGELKRDGVTLQLLWEEYAQVHPHGYRRLDAASARAMALGSCRFHTVKNILATGQDRLPLEPPAETAPTPTHANIRGANYYATTTTREDRC